jgi:hypothetical protein
MSETRISNDVSVVTDSSQLLIDALIGQVELIETTCPVIRLIREVEENR